MATSQESISTFDIFKIGVGPSSSHTMGPWRAAQRFLQAVDDSVGSPTQPGFMLIRRVRVDLFGSLAKTGRGHGTDIAIILGLAGEDPVTCQTEGLTERFETIKAAGMLRLRGHPEARIAFDYDADMLFHMTTSLPFHPNGVTLTAEFADGSSQSETYYSVGGGFIVQEHDKAQGPRAVKLPFPIDKAEDLKQHCIKMGWNIPRVVLENERMWRSDEQIRSGLLRLWTTMTECMYRGCHTEGTLPGGLNVTRRAANMNGKIIHGTGVSSTGGGREYDDVGGWLDVVRHSTREFQKILKWVSTFALAVNEENAAFGRVVTAPTNGSAGVIPSVMMYYWCFCNSSEQGIIEFMLTAGEIGSLFKKGATISAAMGGCQAEIGVSSAMAAAGLTHCLGGTADQCMMAAEIAMEHHLGMTCDPIGGLVQVPCIERNTMGAIKAITAANIALESDPSKARVSLDDVIKTMWETALDMHDKYKETAGGGLAVHVSVGLSEC